MDRFMHHFGRRAALVPALAATLPLALADLSWYDSRPEGWGPLFGLAVLTTLTLLLAGMAHDIGRMREPVLVACWGGEPAHRMLRHRETCAGQALRERHGRLENTILGLRMPTAAEEETDPQAADEVYRYVLSFLRERVRMGTSASRGRLYGYRLRRNLWGFKPLGIATAALGAAVAVALVALKRISRDGYSPALAVAVAVLNLGLATGWFFLVTPEWVQASAEAYAAELLTVWENL